MYRYIIHSMYQEFIQPRSIKTVCDWACVGAAENVVVVVAPVMVGVDWIHVFTLQSSSASSPALHLVFH
jgi:hypothetical protein